MRRCKDSAVSSDWSTLSSREGSRDCVLLLSVVHDMNITFSLRQANSSNERVLPQPEGPISTENLLVRKAVVSSGARGSSPNYVADTASQQLGSITF